MTTSTSRTSPAPHALLPTDTSSERLPTVSTPFASVHGAFTLHLIDTGDDADHLTLTVGDPRAAEAPVVRVQSACITATALGASLCDCRQQLDLALARVADAGCGVVLYLAQEGRSHGLRRKVQELALMAEHGLDTVDAASALGIAPDLRDYRAARVILDELLGPAHPIAVMTNNPAKLDGLAGVGLNVVRRVPHESPPTPTNWHYLMVKKARLGHLLQLVDDHEID